MNAIEELATKIYQEHPEAWVNGDDRPTIENLHTSGCMVLAEEIAQSIEDEIESENKMRNMYAEWDDSPQDDE